MKGALRPGAHTGKQHQEKSVLTKGFKKFKEAFYCLPLLLLNQLHRQLLIIIIIITIIIFYPW